MDNYIPSWDLKTIYKDYDDPDFLAAIAAGEESFTKLQSQITALSGEHFASLEHFLLDYDRAAIAFSTPETYVLLRGKLEQNNPAASAVKSRIDRITLMRQDILSRLSQVLLNVTDIDTLMAVYPSLAPYRFLLSENKRLAEHRPDPDIQSVLRTMQATGGSSWLNLHCTLDSTAQVSVPFDNGTRTIPLSEARGFAGSANPEHRKKAYFAELSSYPSYETSMAACLNGIKGEAIAELPYKHYHSEYEEMLDINKMQAATLESMMNVLKEHLPALRRYLAGKAKYLGYDHGLPWYELLAPLGTSQSSFSFGDAHNLLVDAFEDFSPEMGAFIDYAFRNRWIDALPAKGRQSGGICIDLPELKECRILVNYNGSLKDIRTIAHELGHAYHCRCLDHLPLWLRDAPTPICETASIMNETIFHQKCIELKDKESLLYLLDANLSEEVQTIMDIYSRFLFEKQVFEIRKDRELLPKEFCQLMTDAQKEVFGDALDHRYLHPYMWMNKVHYYIPEFHYYNYPYIFGMLFSKGLYSNYLKDQQGFPEKYRELLSFTCSGSLEEIAAKAEIDITSTKFWQESFRQIDQEVEQFLSLL